jgi:TPR repeat protein
MRIWTAWLGLGLLAACAFKLSAVERAELPVCSGPHADECVQCRAGVTAACGRLADRYEYGYGVRVDDRAPGLLRAYACELGDTAACYWTTEAVEVGLRLEQGGVAATNRVTICQRAKNGCGGGSGELCTVVARCAQYKDRDDREAQALLERTCAGGYAPACYFAALRATGEAGTTEMYRRGCVRGYAPACVEYAYMDAGGGGAQLLQGGVAVSSPSSTGADALAGGQAEARGRRGAGGPAGRRG